MKKDSGWDTYILTLKTLDKLDREARLRLGSQAASSDLKEALLALDLKPNTIIFFDRRTIDSKGLSEIKLDLDYARGGNADGVHDYSAYGRC